MTAGALAAACHAMPCPPRVFPLVGRATQQPAHTTPHCLPLTGAPLESSPLLNSPAVTPADMAQPGAGVKRGLLDAAFCLSAAQEVGGGLG